MKKINLKHDLSTFHTSVSFSTQSHKHVISLKIRYHPPFSLDNLDIALASLAVSLYTLPRLVLQPLLPDNYWSLTYCAGLTRRANLESSFTGLIGLRDNKNEQK